MAKTIATDIDVMIIVSTSMDEIVTNLLNSSVPVVVYVYPSGARAASAGLFVAQAFLNGDAVGD